MPQPKDKKIKIYFYFFLLILLSTTYNFNYNSFIKETFKIKKIKTFPDNIVFDEVNDLSNQNIFKINKLSLKKLLNKHTFLKSIEIKKIYPDTLEVIFIKSVPIAIVNNKKSFTYLGDNGKIFRDIKEYYPLPIIKGEIDISKAIEVLNLLDRSLYKLENIIPLVLFSSP